VADRAVSADGDVASCRSQSCSITYVAICSGGDLPVAVELPAAPIEAKGRVNLVGSSILVLYVSGVRGFTELVQPGQHQARSAICKPFSHQLTMARGVCSESGCGADISTVSILGGGVHFFEVWLAGRLGAPVRLDEVDPLGRNRQPRWWPGLREGLVCRGDH
jgi:hypothetical protein